MSEILILKGGEVVDPRNGIDEAKDVLIKDGLIAEIAKPGAFDSQEGKVIDCSSKWVVPGLVDIHVHLREPGQEWKEDVASGSAAAVAGGFTSICCMPNTNPVNDNASVTEFIIDAANRADLARVFPIGAISIGLKGEELAPLLELKEAGCVAFSDDGFPVWDPLLMRKALEYSLMLGAKLTCHEEEKSLSRGFSMNESSLSIELGLKGMPGAAEDIMIARDIELSLLTGAPVHFCHVSTARAVTLIRRAKEDGIPVTAETTPHYLTLDENSVVEHGTAAKMSMPLRSLEDQEALIKGLADGTIDCIASDHAPHEIDTKRTEFPSAAFGILGLQTTLPLTLARVRDGSLSRSRAIESLSSAPANCLNLDGGHLSKGAVADVAIVDPEASIEINKDTILSKSKNTPFMGQTLQGVADATIVGGKLVYTREEGIV